MHMRLLAYLHSWPFYSHQRRAQFTALSYALHNATIKLEEARALAASGATPVKISEPLWRAVLALSVPQSRIKLAFDPDLVPGSLAEQLSQKDRSSAHRWMIYEMALLSAEALRTGLLSLLRDMNEGATSSDVTRGIASLMRVATHPASDAILPPPKEKVESKKSRARKKTSA